MSGQTGKRAGYVGALVIVGFIALVGRSCESEQSVTEPPAESQWAPRPAPFTGRRATPVQRRPWVEKKPTLLRTGDTTRIVAKHPGWTTYDNFIKHVGYAKQKDKEAWLKFGTAGLLTGECTLFEKGELVYVVDKAIFSDAVKLRRKGETQAYWTYKRTVGE